MTSAAGPLVRAGELGELALELLLALAVELGELLLELSDAPGAARIGATSELRPRDGASREQLLKAVDLALAAGAALLAGSRRQPRRARRAAAGARARRAP